VLLECNLVGGVADGILGAIAHRGMPSGAGASGQADAAYGRELGSQPVVLLSRPVDSRLGYEPESVFATLCPKIHAPTKTTKESVAWKKEKKQVAAKYCIGYSQVLFCSGGCGSRGERDTVSLPGGAHGFGRLAQEAPAGDGPGVIESTTNAWHVYDLFEAAGGGSRCGQPDQGQADSMCTGKDRQEGHVYLGALLAANLGADGMRYRQSTLESCGS